MGLAVPRSPPTLRPKRGPGLDEARAAARRASDRRRAAESETRRLYGTEAWKRLREAQLRAQPLCEMCLARGVETPATVCNHAIPHRGDVARFWAGPFESLCKPCHDGPVQSEERRGLRDALDDEA